jgi:hypothetical protein
MDKDPVWLATHFGTHTGHTLYELRNTMEDIVILDESPAPDGIIDDVEDPMIGVIVEPKDQKPPQIQGYDVMANGQNMLLMNSGGSVVPLAYIDYVWSGERTTYYKAAYARWNEVDVFAPSDADLAVFLSLTQKLDIKIPKGNMLIFFVSDKTTGIFSGGGYQIAYDNISFMQYGGSFVNYRVGISEDNEFMVLDGSPCIAGNSLFIMIKKFISRTLKSTKIDLRDVRRKIEFTERDRDEEVYLYLSDLKTPDDKKEIHDFILAQKENDYVASQALLAEQRAKESALVAKIKQSSVILPSGRKGTALRNSYLIGPALGQMLDELYARCSSTRLDFKFVFRNDLVVENINYGRPVININMNSDRGRGRDGTFIYSVTASSRDKKAFIHPHLDGARSWCLGTYIMPIQNALLGGNMPMAAALIWQYLSRYNADSPLVQLELCRTTMLSASDKQLIVRRK